MMMHDGHRAVQYKRFIVTRLQISYPFAYPQEAETLMTHAKGKHPADKPAKANDDTTATTTASPAPADDRRHETPPNPPRTTTGRWWTAPKFGSAGSGGAELEPGPERD